jgi:ferredoxin
MNDFAKPWRGMPRELIQWNPQIEEEICIGCGMCVTECGRMVSKFDFKKKMPVVASPLNCMVACFTCANASCPSHAISFPPLNYVYKLTKEKTLSISLWKN